MAKKLTVILPEITLKLSGMHSEKSVIEAMSSFYKVIRVSSKELEGLDDNVETIYAEPDVSATRTAIEGLNANLILWPAIYGYPIKNQESNTKVLWIVGAHSHIPDYPGVYTLDEAIAEVSRTGLVRKEMGA